MKNRLGGGGDRETREGVSKNAIFAVTSILMALFILLKTYLIVFLNKFFQAEIFS